MDSFELNKIAGAILGTLLVVVGSGVVADMIWEREAPERPGYEIAVPEEPAAGGAPVAAEVTEPIAVRLQAADVARGEAAVRKCASCHTVESGAPSKVGPNLFGVVGRRIASHPGFAYSEALQQLGQAGSEWTYENLDLFLLDPKDFAPGTTMAFAGIRRPAERADVIAYLRSISPNAPPIPEPAPTGAATSPVNAAQSN